MTRPRTLHSTAQDALDAVRAQQAAGRILDMEALDGELRWHVLRFLQDAVGDLGALTDTLLDATLLAEQANARASAARWEMLIALLSDARLRPGPWHGLQAMREGRSGELISQLIAADAPLRPREIAERMHLSESQVSSLLLRLEQAGLIDRRRGGSDGDGRAVHVFLLPALLRLRALLPPSHEVEAERAPAQIYWLRSSEPAEID